MKKVINGWHVAPSLDDSGEKIVSIQIARAGVGFTSMTTVSGYTNLDRFSCRPAKLQAPKKLIYLNTHTHTPVVPSIFFQFTSRTLQPKKTNNTEVPSGSEAEECC